MYGAVYLDHVDDDLVSVLVLGQLDGHCLRLPRPHLTHLNQVRRHKIKQCFSSVAGPDLNPYVSGQKYGSGSFHYQAKIVRQTLIATVL